MKTINEKMHACILSIAALIVLIFGACKKTPFEPGSEFLPKISDYKMFRGNQANLIPDSGFVFYELSSTLFTDHAEKQRLVSVPSGTLLKANDNGILKFPDGAILVKTFYYFNDKTDSAKGKRIIETRLLQKAAGKWTAATYLWNKEQTDANLITANLNKTVNWIDENGKANVISYHIPSANECGSCHNSNNALVPIGPKTRNLNTTVLRNNINQNQLSYFQGIGILTSSSDLSSFDSLPAYANTAAGIAYRARAYLDVNCAHCHNKAGIASDTNLDLDYAETLQESSIKRHKDEIIKKFEQGKMPKAGTTIIDKEGLELIRLYIQSL